MREQIERAIREYVTEADEHVLLAEDIVPLAERIASVVAPIVGGSADKQAASILSQARVRGFEMYDHDWKGIKGGEFVFTLDVPASVFEGRSVEEVENELRAVTTK